MAPRSIAPGTEYGEAIIAGIEQAEVFVLVYSKHSNQSQHVLREVERCVNKNTPLIAYKIEEVQPTKSMEYFLMANQWMQAADAPKEHMQELYDAVVHLLGGAKESGQGDAKNTAKKNAAPRVRGGKIAVACILLAVVAVTVFCLKNSQKGCGGDVPSAADGNLPGQAQDGAADGNLPGQAQDGADDGEAGLAQANGGTGLAQANEEENTEPKENTEPEEGTAPKQTAEPQQTASLSVKPGEYITFGRYYPQGQENTGDAEISWIVLSVDEKEKTVLMLSEKILDMKPYDVAESGVYGRGTDGNAYDRTKAEEYSKSMLSVFYGNSSWEYSNLRAWLNCADSAVSYEGQEPVSKGTDDGVNGYQNQAGFLYDFTEKERDRLVVTQVQTPGNAIGSASETDDLVFLLSAQEAELYLDGQKISRYAAPTDAAIAASRGTIYPLYHSYSQETIPWYFRTPAEGSAHEILLCGSGFAGEGDVITKYACSAGSGVRPAVVIRLEDGEFSGEGTRISPYQMDGE